METSNADTVHFSADKGATEIPREGFGGREFDHEGQDGGSPLIRESELDREGIVGHGDTLEGRGTRGIWGMVSKNER